MKLDTEVFKKWISWANKIKEDLQVLLINQQIFCEFSEIAQANWEHIKKNDGFLFCYFIRTCYTAQAAVGIRRHLKIDKDSISLKQLMDQIKKCASQFTYDFYLSQYPIDDTNIDWQKGTFYQFSHDGKVMSVDIIDTDIENLEKLGKDVETYVDCQLAHLDRQDWNGKITYGDLKKIIDQLNRLTCKYLSLITAESFFTLQPSISSDLKSIFRVPINIQNLDNTKKIL